jgi:acid phosphatase (class A)
MRLRSLILIPLLMVAACEPATASKYPFPPQYLSGADVPPQSIPAPPKKGSAEYNREVDEIVAIQSKLTAKDIAEIQHQIDIKPELIVYPVLGEQYNEANYPKLYALLKHVASDSWRIGDETRVYWKSPRPWYTESRVKRHVEVILTPGYPSGHTTTFGSWAYVLSDLFPEKADALFTKAWSVGGNRIAGGAHYPHDIVGGKALAAAIYYQLEADPKYRADLAAVRAELTRGGSVKQAKALGCHCHHGKKRPQPQLTAR